MTKLVQLSSRHSLEVINRALSLTYIHTETVRHLGYKTGCGAIQASC